MPDVKWIKLTVGMFDDEKIKLVEAMPDADTLLVIWIKLLCLAGKVNSNGYIYLSADLPYTAEDLATIFNRPLNTIRLAIKTFERLQMIEVDGDGVLYLKNWSKHQNFDALEQIREKTRLRQQRFYDKHKRKQLPQGNPNVSITPTNAVEGEGRGENKNKIYTPYNPPLKRGMTFREYYLKNEYVTPGNKIQSLCERYVKGDLSDANIRILLGLIKSQNWLDEFGEVLKEGRDV